jgi:hypothetical protein
MAQVPAVGFEEHWQNKLEALRLEYKDLVKEHPEAKDTIETVNIVLNGIVFLTRCTPKNIGESKEWTR